MVVVPLITSALIAAMINISAGRDLGRLGVKTLTWYFGTTVLAVLTALLVFNVLSPGVIDGEPAGARLGLASDTSTVVASMAERGAGDFAGIILQVFPPNIIKASAEGQLLGLIVFSISFGMVMRAQQGPAADTLKQMISAFYDTMVSIFTMLIVRINTNWGKADDEHGDDDLRVLRHHGQHHHAHRPLCPTWCLCADCPYRQSNWLCGHQAIELVFLLGTAGTVYSCFYRAAHSHSGIG